MKSLIKKAIRRFLASDFMAEFRADHAGAQEVQAALAAQYIAMRGWPAEKLPRFSDVGFLKYSQFEEDGILLYIFSLIGATNRKVVKVWAGCHDNLVTREGQASLWPQISHFDWQSV